MWTKIVFFCFLFRFFSIFGRKFFRLLAKKLQKIVKTTFACPQEQLVALKFFKIFEPFWIFCRNLWHGSQNSIQVSRVKIAELVFFCISFQIFFDFWAKFFQTFGQKTSKICENYLCVSTGTTCGFKIFLKVLNRFGFSAETFGMVLKSLSTFPE